ncbi:unnamed protein product [Amoebophrya sp. A120]|nr:unnamed protein product [Amoebophrya sp. A120]|eukprot:GSA120T00007424001.1
MVSPPKPIVPTERYQKLCIYNPMGHVDKGQHAEIVIQLRHVSSSSGAQSEYAKQPKKQPDSFSLKNNPQQLQHFPFPKSFRRKVAEIDLSKNLELELLEPFNGRIGSSLQKPPTSSATGASSSSGSKGSSSGGANNELNLVKIDPDEITTEVAGQKRKFPGSGLEMAFSRRAEKEVRPDAIEARKKYLEENDDLPVLFDKMFDFLMSKKPITPKSALADFLFQQYEHDRLDRDRKARLEREKELKVEPAKVLIPKPPTKVIEYKLEDERRRQDQKDKKQKKIDMLEAYDAEQKLIQRGRDLLRNKMVAKAGQNLKNKFMGRKTEPPPSTQVGEDGSPIVAPPQDDFMTSVLGGMTVDPKLFQSATMEDLGTAEQAAAPSADVKNKPTSVRVSAAPPLENETPAAPAGVAAEGARDEDLSPAASGLAVSDEVPVAPELPTPADHQEHADETQPAADGGAQEQILTSGPPSSPAKTEEVDSPGVGDHGSIEGG